MLWIYGVFEDYIKQYCHENEPFLRPWTKKFRGSGIILVDIVRKYTLYSLYTPFSGVYICSNYFFFFFFWVFFSIKKNHFFLQKKFIFFSQKKNREQKCLFLFSKKNIYGVPQRILKKILQISESTWLDGTVFCLF